MVDFWLRRRRMAGNVDGVEHKDGKGMVGNADMVENEEMAKGWQRDGR